jgi:hypothetical protein
MLVKLITFSRFSHPVELFYMLGGLILGRADSITDLGVVMDSRMSFSRHIYVTFRKALAFLAMLGFVKRILSEFWDHNTRTEKTR